VEFQNNQIGPWLKVLMKLAENVVFGSNGFLPNLVESSILGNPDCLRMMQLHDIV
jgi:hypothetical protein